MALEVLDIVDEDFDEIPEEGIGEEVEVAFRKLNRNFSALLIWRIEDSSVIALQKDQYGSFHDNEAYIIYAATPSCQHCNIQTVSREIRGPVEYHIHFWLGKSVSTEKAGVAAYKTVELDDYLGGKSIEHREVQGNESSRFKSYFLQGIKIISGEYGDLSTKIFGEFEPHLYWVKGTRAPIVTQLPKVSWNLFNSGTVYLLHTKNTLFVWFGRAVSLTEKMLATKVALQMRTDQNIPNIAFVDDGYERQMSESEKYEFELFLRLSMRIVKGANEVEDENISSHRQKTNIKLYQCAEVHHKYRVTEIKTGPLKQDDLHKHDVYILDHSPVGIWVWVGKKANDKEQKEALRNARGFVKKKKYPNNIQVTRVVGGHEPVEFKTLFDSWKEKDKSYLIGHISGNKIAVIKVTKFDALTMHERPALAAKSQLIDDGSGNIMVLRTKRYDVVEVPKDRHGIFFTADCYIIVYNYRTHAATKYVIYYWFGSHSINDEQQLAMDKCAEIDATLTESQGIQIRVYEGFEPPHFLQLFRGKLKIFCGKGTDFDLSGKNLKTPNHYLLCVEGTSTYNTKATQVPLRSASLNSNCCFVLRKGNVYYIWCGNNSTGDNKEMAKGFVGADFMILMEGNESPEYWNTIGGKEDYEVAKKTDFTPKLPAKLFHCSFTLDGSFKAEEILNFTQTDLAPESIMILDAHTIIYVWIGNSSTKDQKKLSLQMANEYLSTDPSGKNLKTPIAVIKQRFEPPTFIGFFEAWDNNLYKDYKSFDELRSEMEKTSSHSINSYNLSRHDSIFNNYDKYPLHILQGSAENLPSSVDILQKELHLTYDDFLSVFKMEYSDFEKLPQWRQKELKKKVGLF